MSKRRSRIGEVDVRRFALQYLKERTEHDVSCLIDEVVWDKWGQGTWFVRYHKTHAVFGLIEHGSGLLEVDATTGEAKESFDSEGYRRALSRKQAQDRAKLQSSMRR